MKDIRWKLAALAAAAIVAACGGDEPADGPSNRVGINAMVSFGDNLSDVGNANVGSISDLGMATGGAGRFTVNATSGGQIWTEHIAARLPVATTCAAETGLSPNIPGLTGAPTAAKAGCTNYAQGSARAADAFAPDSYILQLTPSNPINIGLTAKSVEAQMIAHMTSVGGSYTGKELVTVQAGVNDIIMELQKFGAVSPQRAVERAQLQGAALGSVVKTYVVNKGAKYVLVLNLPDLAATPFAKHQSAETRGLITAMTQAFNAGLASMLSSQAPGVLQGDAYTESQAIMANPAHYGVTNTTTPACGPNALSSPPAAPGSSLVCNASNVISGDVSHYYFADDLYPTPYGHQLLSQFAAKLMAQAGWL